MPTTLLLAWLGLNPDYAPDTFKQIWPLSFDFSVLISVNEKINFLNNLLTLFIILWEKNKVVERWREEIFISKIPKSKIYYEYYVMKWAK